VQREQWGYCLSKLTSLDKVKAQAVSVIGPKLLDMIGSESDNRVILVAASLLRVSTSGCGMLAEPQQLVYLRIRYHQRRVFYPIPGLEFH
jgi:hypothetical protein